MSDISLRRMIEADLIAIDELRRLAGWNQTPEDWRRLLQLEPDGCFVAVQESREVLLIKLDATPAGQSVYERLGFVSDWTLTRYLRASPGQDRPIFDTPAGTRLAIEGD